MARFMGPTWGPPGADRTQVGPMWATWTLLSGNLIDSSADRGRYQDRDTFRNLEDLIGGHTLNGFCPWPGDITAGRVCRRPHIRGHTKYLGREIYIYSCLIVLKLDRHLVATPVKYRRDMMTLTPNPSTSSLHEVWLFPDAYCPRQARRGRPETRGRRLGSTGGLLRGKPRQSSSLHTHPDFQINAVRHTARKVSLW